MDCGKIKNATKSRPAFIGEGNTMVDQKKTGEFIAMVLAVGTADDGKDRYFCIWFCQILGAGRGKNGYLRTVGGSFWTVGGEDRRKGD